MIIPVFVSKHKVRNASECEQNHTVKISIHVPTNRHIINYTVWYLFQHTHFHTSWKIKGKLTYKNGFSLVN